MAENHMWKTKKKKSRAKTRIYMVYFDAWKIRVLGVFWKSCYKDDIQLNIQMLSPLPATGFGPKVLRRI